MIACPHCKTTDMLVALKRERRMLRDVSYFDMGCETCGHTWTKRRSWRDPDREGWKKVLIWYEDSAGDLFRKMFPPQYGPPRPPPAHDYDYYVKHGDIGKEFHIYKFGHPSHHIDPLDKKMKPEVACAFVREWIVDNDELEFAGAFMRPEDFVTEFKFRNKVTGDRWKVPVEPKQSLVWDEKDKEFKVGTFTVCPMPRLNLGGLFSMEFDLKKALE